MSALRLRPKVLVASFFALAVVVATLVATTGGMAQGSGSTLVVDMNGDWVSMDPMVDGTPGNMHAIVRPGYDSLVGISKDGKDFIPYIATSWKQTPRSIQFTLRRDAKCSDGHVLTPIDILNSFKRFIQVPKRSGSPSNASPGGWGPGPWHLHANAEKALMTLSTDKPWRNFLGLIASLPILCPSGLEAAKNVQAIDNAVYGSGPYTLVSEEHAKQIVWKLRPEWKWGPPGTSTAKMPRNLIWNVVINPTTVANQLVTGAVDYASVTGPDVDRLKADSSLSYTQVKNWIVNGLAFNMNPGRMFALGDGDKLREAVFLAVDPKLFNQAAFNGTGEVSLTQFRPGAECYPTKAAKLRPQPSIDKAKQVLQAAGYTGVGSKLAKDGKALPTVNLLTSSALLGQSGSYLLSVLNQLGFDVQLNESPVTYGTAAIAGNFDILIQFGNRPFNEPGSNMSPRFGSPPPNGNNVSNAGFGDPLWNKYYNAALQNVGAGSCKYFELLEEQNLKGHYVVPLAAPYFDVFARKAVVADVPKWSPLTAGMPWYWVAMK
jgi:peptide/nickel transport system substrate-binding protein